MQKQTSTVRQNVVRKGHVNQGRFKSFAVKTNEYLLMMCRYVERNPVRAGLVARAEQWRWSSAGQCGSEGGVVSMNDWPIALSADWLHWVNQSELQEQIAAVRRRVLKGQPFGSQSWIEEMVVQWNLGVTMLGRERPRKGLEN